ncbi:MAG: peptidoglycan DD-metalloendopeptidase family protein [Cytophagales bacterium]|nr:peptidoglycan DD-metalloendopeptidase family protein [Cytophagales bacterium]
MNSLKALGLIYAVVIWTIVVILIGFLIYRIYKVFLKKSDRKPIGQITGNWYPKVLKILFGLSMLLTIVYAPFYAYVGSAFKFIIPNYLNNLLVIITFLVAGLECFLTLTISEKLIQKIYKKVILTIIVIIMLPLSVYLTIYIPHMFAYLSEKECYLVDLPVKGIWTAGHAGGSEIVNYHCAVKAQMYAMDIVKVNNNGQFFEGEGKDITDFYTMGENIYSPVSGIVVSVVDSLPNAGITFMPMDTLNPAGNHVVIEFKKDRYVFLAHLDKKSVKVKEGDRVKAGNLIAQAGNSGNTSWPHLHMHIQDKSIIDNENAIGFPYRFKKMERKRWLTWTTVTNDFLVRNDFFKNAE